LIVPCELCGKPFKPKTKRQRFCSRICRNKWLSNKNTIKGINVRDNNGVPVVGICDRCSNKYYIKSVAQYRKSKKHYCSVSCYNSDRKDGIVTKKGLLKKCLMCGKVIYAIPSMTDRKKFCSKKCSSRYSTIVPKKKKKGVYVKCKNCGKAMYQQPCFIGKSFFCSMKCAGMHRANRANSKRLVVKCKQCGKEYTIPPSEKYWKERRGSTNYFCSRKCIKKYRQIPENNPRYYKDRTKLKNQKRSFRYSVAMTEWRKKVYKRDNYTCQICSIRSGKNNIVMLNAHHIIRMADNPDLMFQINNGITLCEGCHRKTYKKEKSCATLFFNKIGVLCT